MLLVSNAEFLLRNKWFLGLVPGVIPDAVYAEYLRCFKDPATLHAMCEDYRATATVDLEHDKADLATKVQCPLLAVWDRNGGMQAFFDVEATWRERAANVKGLAMPGGHYLPEQVPNELLAELLPFLS
jgi:haloacetate dehalogenase